MASREPMWFCHECNAEMRPLMVPDPHCASCNSTFVEKMENPEDDPRQFHDGGLGGMGGPFETAGGFNDFIGPPHFNHSRPRAPNSTHLRSSNNTFYGPRRSHTTHVHHHIHRHPIPIPHPHVHLPARHVYGDADTDGFYQPYTRTRTRPVFFGDDTRSEPDLLLPEFEILDATLSPAAHSQHFSPHPPPSAQTLSARLSDILRRSSDTADDEPAGTGPSTNRAQERRRNSTGEDHADGRNQPAFGRSAMTFEFSSPDGARIVIGGDNTLGRAPGAAGPGPNHPGTPTMSDFIRDARTPGDGPDGPIRGEIPGQLMMQYLMSIFGGMGGMAPARGHEGGAPPPFFLPMMMGMGPPGEGQGGGQWGDYVFSQEALDRIITQMMESANAHRPVPATDEIMEKLPREVIEAGSPLLEKDCAVCKDQFTVENEDPDNQVVITLPCKHPFHEGCILPWLKSSGTCPVCRHALVPQPNADHSGPGPSGSGPSGSNNPSGGPPDSGSGSGSGPNAATRLFNLFRGPSHGSGHGSQSTSNGAAHDSAHAPPGGHAHVFATAPVHTGFVGFGPPWAMPVMPAASVQPVPGPYPADMGIPMVGVAPAFMGRPQHVYGYGGGRFEPEPAFMRRARAQTNPYDTHEAGPPRSGTYPPPPGGAPYRMFSSRRRPQNPPEAGARPGPGGRRPSGDQVFPGAWRD